MFDLFKTAYLLLLALVTALIVVLIHILSMVVRLTINLFDYSGFSRRHSKKVSASSVQKLIWGTLPTTNTHRSPTCCNNHRQVSCWGWISQLPDESILHKNPHAIAWLNIFSVITWVFALWFLLTTALCWGLIRLPDWWAKSSTFLQGQSHP